MKKFLLFVLLFFAILNGHAQIFHENFDPPSLGDSVTSYSSNPLPIGHDWAINSRLFQSSPNCDSAYLGNSDTLSLTTQMLDFTSINCVLLSFDHICKISFFDKASLYYSYDSTLWTQVDASMYMGSAPFGLQLNSFSSASYGNWYPGLPDTIPDNSWWHHEAFDLSSVAAQIPVFWIRWQMYDQNGDITDTLNGWKIDNILIDTIGIGNSFMYSIFNPCGGIPQTVSFEIGSYAWGYQPTDSLNVHFFFGDGTDTTYTLSFQQGGFFSLISHNYTMPGTYSTQGIFYSSIGINDTITEINSLLLTDTCGNIEGKLYVDDNADCIFNGADEGIKYKALTLTKNGLFVRHAMSDYSGDFSFQNIPQDTYSLFIDSSYWFYSSANLSITCPVSGSYNVTNVPSSGNDFALDCNSGMDLFTLINAWQLRPGITSYIHPFFSANTCEFSNGQAMLVLDSLTPFVSSNPSPDAINGDTLIWNFTNMNLNNSFHLMVAILPDASFNIGDVVCFTTIIQPFTGDSDTLNNVDYDCAVIVNSCDPNNKSVSPEGNIPPSQNLDYVINFQNTGNDVAYNVFIVDTISANLDINTLRVNGSSHNMSIDVLNNQVLKFNFNNIMLPDSNTNEPASHGFISYSIKPVLNLANGTVISNTADIYFDFNLPVITNTTINTIDSTIVTGNSLVTAENAHEIKLIPNPVSDELTITSQSELSKIEIINLFGEVVFQKELSNFSYQLSSNNFSNGIYIIKVFTGEEIFQQKLIVNH